MIKTASAFLAAFAAEIGDDEDKAAEQWAGFSRQLSKRERETAERGGTRSGTRMGREFCKLYPAQEDLNKGVSPPDAGLTPL